MTCTNCGRPLKGHRENHHYAESGLTGITLMNVEVRTCAKCGAREVVIPRIEQLHRLIADEVSRKPGILDPAEIRFLRKYLGWSGVDFAAYMGVTPETVSRWERGQDMGSVADRLLRLLVANREPATHYPLDVFKEPARHVTTLRFKADPEWRRARAA